MAGRDNSVTFAAMNPTNLWPDGQVSGSCFFPVQTHNVLQLLQCCSSKISYTKVKKLTLYLYINIEVFLGYGNSFKRTATLQHCNSFCQYIQERKKNPRKMKNLLWSIREPQSLFLTFAVSNWNSGQAVFKGKNCED